MVAATVAAVTLSAQEEARIASVQYWIDGAHTAATAGSATEFDMDCSALPSGLHTLHYRVADSQGRYSALHSHSFLKIKASSTPTAITSIQYWWDDFNSNAVTAPYSAEEFVLAADALPIGLHSLKYRVMDDAGRWSELRTHYFYKGGFSLPAQIVSYSYWWNDLTDKIVSHTLDVPAASFAIDEELTVPDEARTSFAGHYTATLNFAVTDSRGRTSFVSAGVVYPDNDPPVTDIDADRYVATSTVKLTWTESSGDRMGDYNVYVSKDGAPFLLWLPDTKATTATFRGERGSAYIFTVTGRDASGNREAYDETKCVSVTFE